MHLKYMILRIDSLNKLVYQLVDSNCESGLYTPMSHLPDNLIQDIDMSGTLQLLT